jgi:sulfur carrier protein
MKNIKKIKIKVNGEIKLIRENTNLSNLIRILKIPINKVAIELNQEILDKKKLKIIRLKKNDKIEVVHFIGGG